MLRFRAWGYPPTDSFIFLHFLRSLKMAPIFRQQGGPRSTTQQTFLNEACTLGVIDKPFQLIHSASLYWTVSITKTTVEQLLRGLAAVKGNFQNFSNTFVQFMLQCHIETLCFLVNWCTKRRKQPLKFTSRKLGLKVALAMVKTFMARFWASIKSFKFYNSRRIFYFILHPFCFPSERSQRSCGVLRSSIIRKNPLK